MPKSIRIRTEPGVDRDINVKIDQDFDSLEILSLKLRQEDLYTQFCADYGVVVGRVIANGGLGIPNAHISIFIPLDDVDESDPIISTLYPYKTPTTKNEDGYRYNLLPYEDEYYGHNGTGTFPTVDDVLTRKEVLQVYEKYYKYSVRTNDSGDFMIVGVPLGNQKLVMDLDLSNMGEFSLRPSDLIRMGRGVPSQFNGQLFKDSENIDSLPQILNEVKDIDVSSFWGQDDICDVGITRVDFDLSDQGIEITPHSVFMGSLFSSNEDDYIKATCRPKKDTGNLCDTVAGPGEILAIRQTIQEDENGDPVLEQYQLEDGGNVINDNGAWLIDLPMNMNYVTTNEFGERVTSPDPSVGIPTQAKYRFKIKWQNEAGLQTQIMRANYLIPNIKEHWNGNPISGIPFDLNKSYSFSLDWSDYYDKDAAIKCEDTFYSFGYNKVYTTAAHIDRWKYGANRASHYGIKEILNRDCMSENNRFPVNDGQRNFDFLYFLFNILLGVITPTVFVIIPIMHVLALLYPIVRLIVNLLVTIINPILYLICKAVAFLSRKVKKSDCKKDTIKKLPKENPFKRLTLPMITYPDCEACSCDDVNLPDAEDETITSLELEIANANQSNLADFVSIGAYNDIVCSTSSVSPGGVVPPTININSECYACYNGQPSYVAAQYNQLIFSGYDPDIPPPSEPGEFNPPFTPPAQWSKSPFSLQTHSSEYHSTFTTTLPQSLNLMNQRSRYFDTTTPNRMLVDIVNDQLNPNGVPNTSPITHVKNRYEDMPLVTVLDGNVNLTPGQLLTFVDGELIDDPNVNNTGMTVNQFGYQSLTGTMVSNPSAYVTRPCSYIDGNGTPRNIDLELYSPVPGASYNFKTGIEYYQVIGSMDVSDARAYLSGVTANSSDSILWKYFLDKDCQYFCDRGNSNWAVPIQDPLDYFEDADNVKIYFIAKGVDPYSGRQKIKYDLNRLFGELYNANPNFIFQGDYFPNIPIQEVSNANGGNGDDDTPAPHYDIDLPPGTIHFDDGINDNTALFHGSYLFTPISNSGTTFQSFFTRGFAYYSSLDYQFGTTLTNFGSSNGVEVTGSFLDPLVGYDVMSISTTLSGQSKIEGASYQWTDTSPQANLTSASKVYTISPSYWLWNAAGLAPKINMNDETRLIFRSDRLPTSSVRDEGALAPYQDFCLHLNDTFVYFTVTDTGVSEAVSPNTSVGSTDGSGGAADYGDEPQPGFMGNGILQSFECSGLKVLECYNGTGSNFSVDNPCDLDDRTQGGCYVFVDNPLIISIPKDFKFFFEWRTRFRFMFGACRGVVGHMFQNNWINGTLYMPSFQKKTFYDSNNEVKRYKYCGDPFVGNGGLFGNQKQMCGPLYFNTDSNSFFYRSAPYNTNTNQFKPQGDCYGGFFGLNNIGSNDGNIWQPTTIMDLGPKTDFLKEVLLTPEFQGYIMDEIESTSYQDISGLLNLFIISRLVDANFLEQLLGVGDASIQQLFSRDPGLGLVNRFFDSRVDGDYAQACSINTEFGVLPYLAGNYEDEVAVGDSLFGVWFTGSTVSPYNTVGTTVADRRIVGPGELTFSEDPLLVSNFNYIGSQTVPFYTWEFAGGNMFGTEENTWKTNTCQTGTYQDEKFDGANQYAKPTTGLGTGFIFNRPVNVYPGSVPTDNGNDGYRVGSPFQFYFGLKRGKSAMNLFITKFIFNRDLNG